MKTLNKTKVKHQSMTQIPAETLFQAMKIISSGYKYQQMFFSELEIPCTRLHQVFFSVMEIPSKIYTDQTGRFPVTSVRAYKYMMVPYEKDSNTIMVYPIKLKEGVDLPRA